MEEMSTLIPWIVVPQKVNLSGIYEPNGRYNVKLQKHDSGKAKKKTKMANSRSSEGTLRRCLYAPMNPWAVFMLSIYIFPLNTTKLFSASALRRMVLIRQGGVYWRLGY